MIATPVLLSGLLVGLLVAGGPARADSADPGLTPLSEVVRARDYDPAPFVQALRKPYAKNPKASLGVASLAELPLYQLQVRWDPLERRLHVSQTINVRNPERSAWRDLVLRWHPEVAAALDQRPEALALGRVTLDGRPVTIDHLRLGTWRLPLAAPLATGARVLVGISYSLRPPGLAAAATSGVLAADPNELQLGFFYPLLAGREKGVWRVDPPDGPERAPRLDPANYLVQLTLPSAFQVAASGRVVGEHALGSGPQAPKEVYFVGAALRAFALQASTRYQVIEREQTGLKVRYFYLPESASGAEAILGLAGDCMRGYDRLLGTYPYPDLDLADAPLRGPADGLSYPGLVVLSARALAPQAIPGLPAGMGPARGELASLVAHELSHQWWAWLVASDAAAQPFWDEALANYSPLLLAESSYGKPAAKLLRDQLVRFYQLYRHLGGEDGVVDRPREAYAHQSELTAMVYVKGALFFDAVRKRIGAKAFDSGLREFVRKNAFGQAGSVQWLALMGQRTGKTKMLSSLYRRWIRERHADADIGLYDDKAAARDMAEQAAQLEALWKSMGADPAALRQLQRVIQGSVE